MKTVFISYSSRDVDEAEKIAKQLAENKISYFKAPETIPAGSNYAREIPAAIRECGIFLLLISRNSMNSVWVEKEIDCAINHRRIIVPVQLSPTPLNDLFSFYLNNVQIIRYFENPTAGLIQLQIRIDMILGKAEEPISDDRPKKESFDYLVKDEYEDLTETKKIELSGIDKEIAELTAKKEKIKASAKIVRYYDDEPGKANVFLKGVPKRNSDNSEEKISHREKAQRNNLISVNKIPEVCEKCGGELVEMQTGVYKCVSCGFINYDYTQKVKLCLAENGPLSADEISKETGIDRRVVEYFLLDEKLEIPAWSDIRLACQGCGKPIQSGRYCDACKRTKLRGMEEPRKRTSDDAGYRFIKAKK